jgi:DNA polymerase-3 subunit gamma/tau
LEYNKAVMSSQVFYRKWRPQLLSEVFGQEHVTQTLLNALASGNISHAYLFCGPRGTGKTSTARGLAKAVNCLTSGKGEPCNNCEMCQAITENRSLDVIEVDAASNRRIDEIRELRERVRYAPNQARYKVYIIDEVHMLTTEAANALLKTLEEPPPHVIFILATTETHKILPTR